LRRSLVLLEPFEYTTGDDERMARAVDMLGRNGIRWRRKCPCPSLSVAAGGEVAQRISRRPGGQLARDDAGAGFPRVAHAFERVIEIHFGAQSREEEKQGVGALVRDGSRDDDECHPPSPPPDPCFPTSVRRSARSCHPMFAVPCPVGVMIAVHSRCMGPAVWRQLPAAWRQPPAAEQARWGSPGISRACARKAQIGAPWRMPMVPGRRRGDAATRETRVSDSGLHESLRMHWMSGRLRGFGIVFEGGGLADPRRPETLFLIDCHRQGGLVGAPISESDWRSVN
jgi:hypothetical protein